MQQLDASFRAEGGKFRRRDRAMSVSGQFRRLRNVRAKSVHAPIADMKVPAANGRNVPFAAFLRRSKQCHPQSLRRLLDHLVGGAG